MDRIEIAQACLDAMGDGNYLEIGVNDGASFIPVKARRKWGVDPNYQLSWKRRLKYAVFSRLGLKIEKLYRMTSDEFFAAERGLLEKRGIDVCFIDGLHTYAQVMKDVNNALRYLRPAGVIVLDDCNPATAVIAAPASNINEVIARKIPGWDGRWSGDVWKAVVHLRSLRPDLDAFVLDCDTGIGVVTKSPSPAALPYSARDIDAMDYGALAANRDELLALKPQGYLRDFLRRRFGAGSN